jgi:fatty acid desaturase
MTLTLNAAMLQPIVALLAGILILFIPRILNFVVAIYLIFVGVTGLWPHLLSALRHEGRIEATACPAPLQPRQCAPRQHEPRSLRSESNFWT